MEPGIVLCPRQQVVLLYDCKQKQNPKQSLF